MSATPRSARHAALDALDEVLGNGKLLGDLAEGWTALAPADRAAAGRLAADTLRNLGRADRLLKPRLSKMPPLRVRNALRLATVEICHGGAAHGVVNEAVALVKAHRRTDRYGGLVNAVLRRVAEDGPAAWKGLPVPRLPKWLRGPLIEAWGARSVAAMERAHLAGAPLDLTARGDAAALARRLDATVLPTGSVRLSAPGQVSALPGFETGDWWVQDAAAALPARLFGDLRGKSALDLCAAPGGKTLQLAAAGAEVTALDLSERRLGRLRDNLARTGLSADILVGDALEHRGAYDAVLLDAPCSATGTIRRHPDLPHARGGEGISELIALQARLLDHALGLLAPGGRLVFCTCSLLPDEGECQVEAALASDPGLRVVPPDLPGLDSAWRSDEGGLRLRPDFWPELGGLDGFYMACLERGA